MQRSLLASDFPPVAHLRVEVVHAADAVIVAVERGEDAGLGLEAGAGRGGEQEPEQHHGWRGGGEWSSGVRTLVSSDHTTHRRYGGEHSTSALRVYSVT